MGLLVRYIYSASSLLVFKPFMGHCRCLLEKSLDVHLAANLPLMCVITHISIVGSLPCTKLLNHNKFLCPAMSKIPSALTIVESLLPGKMK